VDLVAPPDQTPLSREEDTIIGADGAPDCPNFEQELSALICFMCEHILAIFLGNRLLQPRQA
jgi:hypothetical protein